MSSLKLLSPWYILDSSHNIYDFSIVLILYVQVITYNLKLRHVYFTIVAVKKQWLLQILRACL